MEQNKEKHKIETVKNRIETIRYDDGEFILLLNGQMVGKPIQNGQVKIIENWFRSYIEQKYN